MLLSIAFSKLLCSKESACSCSKDSSTLLKGFLGCLKGFRISSSIKLGNPSESTLRGDGKGLFGIESYHLMSRFQQALAEDSQTISFSLGVFRLNLELDRQYQACQNLYCPLLSMA
jgi:hypothetical protein